MAADLSTNVQPVPHGKALALILAVSTVGVALCGGAGWLAGGQQMALHAGVGMLAAAAGGLFAWAVLGLLSGPGASVMAGPTTGLMVRLVVTGAGVGFAVIGLGFDRRPVLFAALFGYLVLMATETVLLYRFASSARPDVRAEPPEHAKQDA